MKQFTVSTADVTENAKNTVYPHCVSITDINAYRNAISKDHAYAVFKDGYRCIDNFLYADALPVDCDNDHSDDPAEWVTPDDVAKAFSGIPFAVHYSRHHNKPKGKKSARPRFHVVFPIERVTSAAEYAKLKSRVYAAYSYFDNNALDAARFFFGTKDPEVEFYDGNGNLEDYLWEEESQTLAALGIKEGTRNSTLSKFAGKTVVRYGNTDEAYARFCKEAEKCEIPLPDKELDSIWKSAVKFGEKVAKQDGYIPPDEYNNPTPHKPDDYSDVGQATVFAKFCRDYVRYSPATDYLVYDGICWRESKTMAQAALHDFTDAQLKEAEKHIADTEAYMENTGAADLIAEVGKKKAVGLFSEEQRRAYLANCSANCYRAFVINRRDSKYITAALKEARPMVEIKPCELDADGFLLNTPDYTVDLRKGMNGIQAHKADDFITKCTAVSPGTDGSDVWQKAIDTFFCGDKALEEYVRDIAGLILIGHVYVEALIISAGSGRNGKSTFWNVIARVLGNYSGNISADALTVGCKRNVKPELAETKGKRLLIAAELEEGMRLNTSAVKHFCSTDDIFAEKKYKEPFSFVPSHTLVLYTNHIPKVGANDPGTWRRLIVVPFNAKIQGNSDIKNYADYLFDNAAPAILSWMIEGAERVIKSSFHIEMPKCVKEATAQYRDNSDWLEHFISECCDVGDGYIVPSGQLYTCYRDFCGRTGEYTRSTTDFYAAVDFAGYARKRTAKGNIVSGLRLKTEFSPKSGDENFLN